MLVNAISAEETALIGYKTHKKTWGKTPLIAKYEPGWDSLGECDGQVNTTETLDVPDDWIREHFRVTNCHGLTGTCLSYKHSYDVFWDNGGAQLGVADLSYIGAKKFRKNDDVIYDFDKCCEPPSITLTFTEQPKTWWDAHFSNGCSIRYKSREEAEKKAGKPCVITECREVLRDAEGKELPTKIELQAGELILSLTKRIREREPRLAELEAENDRLKLYVVENIEQGAKWRDKYEAERLARRGDKAELEVLRKFVESRRTWSAMFVWAAQHDIRVDDRDSTVNTVFNLAKQAREKAE